MSAGVELAIAHLRAYEQNSPELFANQVTADFHYKYIPPFMSVGPRHARLWCGLLHRLYRSWELTVVDASEADDEVVVRAEWRAANPAHPDMPATVLDTVVFKYTLVGGRLARGEALYGDFPERGEDEAAEEVGALDLVLAHLRAYEARTPELFPKQVAPGFRYSHLPPLLGTGPGHARRWYDWLHSVYQTWTLTIVDASESNGDVVVRTEWRATDPVDAEAAPVFLDTCVLRYVVRDGKLASCDAVCLDYGEMSVEDAA